MVKLSANFTGYLDRDSDDRFIEKGNYRLLENGIIDHDRDGGRYTVKNLQSSKEWCNLTESGDYVGGKVYKDHLYAFYYNEATNELSLYEIDLNTEDTYEEIFSVELVDNFTSPVSKTVTYEPVTQIIDIDIIENQSNGDLMCYWTDGVNPPWKINITWCKTNSYPHVRDMFNAKIVPPEPNIKYYRDYRYANANMMDKIFQFAQRYVYKDGEKTPISTYSPSAFVPDNIISTTSNASAEVGYYVDEGVVYRFNFNNGNSIRVSEDEFNVDYQYVLANDDGSVLVMYSVGVGLPVLVSRDYGVNWSEGDSEQFEARGCMSANGQYIYAASQHLYLSSDYGQTFVKIRDNIEDLAGGNPSNLKMKCNDDGDMIVITGGAKPSDTFYGRARVFKDYGETTLLSEQVDESNPDMYSHCGDISPNGKNIIVFTGSQQWVSRDWGATFTNTTAAYDGFHSVALYDNGLGFVVSLTESYKTVDYFNSVSSFSDLSSEILKYNFAFVTYSADRYTKYDLNGDVIDFYDVELAGIDGGRISFLDVPDIRTSIQNIENSVNTVEVDVINPISTDVSSIEVYAVDIITGDTFLIDSVENDGSDHTVTFRNNLVYRRLSTTEKNVLFSNIPIKAKHQQFIGDRLFYLNYHDGYNLPNASFEASVDSRDFRSTQYRYTIMSSSINSVRIQNDYPQEYEIKKGDILLFQFLYRDVDGNTIRDRFFHVFLDDYDQLSDAKNEIETTWLLKFPDGEITGSVEYDDALYFTMSSDDEYIDVLGIYVKEKPITLRKGHPVNYGIVYYDEYNRGSFPIFSNGNVIPSEDISTPKTYANIVISHDPPKWAVKYKIVRTDRDLLYYIVPGFQYAKADNGYIYLMKYDADAYLPEPGMYLDTHLGNGAILTMQVTNKITKDADFVEGAPAGEWITVKAPATNGYTASDVNSGTHLYYSSMFYARQSVEAQDNVLFYEVPGEYLIEDGYHQGNDQNQTADTPARVTMPDDGNVFYLEGPDLELINLSNNTYFHNGGRSIIQSDQTKQIHRYTSLTWSDKFVQDTGLNGLSMFNAGAINYKDLDAAGGEINAVKSLESNLYVWQSNDVGYVLIDKNAITTSLGQDVIGQSTQVAGQFRSYAGQYGTKHPKSIGLHGGRRYFVDIDKGVICRLSQDGITEISEQNMSSDFRKVFKDNTDFIGCFNHNYKEYWIYCKEDKTIYAFSEKQNGWARTIVDIDADDFVFNDNVMYGIDGTTIYAHEKGDDYGNVHGKYVPLNFEYVENTEPGVIKVANALEVEANKPVQAQISIGGSYPTDENFKSSTIYSGYFEKREGEYFAYVTPVPDGFSEELTDGGVLVPLGVVDSVDGRDATLRSDIFTTLGQVDHAIFIANVSTGDYQYRGMLSGEDNINGKTITSNESLWESADEGLLVFLVENSYINGHNLRGPFFRIKFTEPGTSRLALFASRLETNLSKNQ